MNKNRLKKLLSTSKLLFIFFIPIIFLISGYANVSQITDVAINKTGLSKVVISQTIELNSITSTKDITNRTTTSTPFPTSTLIPTMSQAPTITQTLTLPYPSIKEIRLGLKEDFQEIKDLIQENSHKDQPPNTAQSIGVGIIGNFISNFLINPIVGWVLTIIGSITLFGKVILLRNRKNNSKIHPSDQHISNIEVSLNAFFDIVIALYFISIVLILLFNSFNKVTVQPGVVGNNIGEVILKLNDLDTKITSLQNQKILPTPTPDTLEEIKSPLSWIESYAQTYSSYIAFALIICLIIIFFMSLFYKRYKYDTETNQSQKTNVHSYQRPERYLLTAVPLILLILLLPSPLKEFLLPFLIPTFFTALFDLVIMFPNVNLKRLVLKNYSTIIFLGQLIIWSRFFTVLYDLLLPFLNFIIIQFKSIPEFAWFFVPYVIAAIISIPGWRSIQRNVERQSLPKIKLSLTSPIRDNPETNTHPRSKKPRIIKNVHPKNNRPVYLVLPKGEIFHKKRKYNYRKTTKY